MIQVLSRGLDSGQIECASNQAIYSASPSKWGVIKSLGVKDFRCRDPSVTPLRTIDSCDLGHASQPRRLPQNSVTTPQEIWPHVFQMVLYVHVMNLPYSSRVKPLQSPPFLRLCSLTRQRNDT